MNTETNTTSTDIKPSTLTVSMPKMACLSMIRPIGLRARCRNMAEPGSVMCATHIQNPTEKSADPDGVLIKIGITKTQYDRLADAGLSESWRNADNRARHNEIHEEAAQKLGRSPDRYTKKRAGSDRKDSGCAVFNDGEGIALVDLGGIVKELEISGRAITNARLVRRQNKPLQLEVEFSVGEPMEEFPWEQFHALLENRAFKRVHVYANEERSQGQEGAGRVIHTVNTVWEDPAKWARRPANCAHYKLRYYGGEWGVEINQNVNVHSL